MIYLNLLKAGLLLLQSGLGLLQFQPLISYSVMSPKSDTCYNFEWRWGFEMKGAKMMWLYERDDGGYFDGHDYFFGVGWLNYEDRYREANELFAQSIKFQPSLGKGVLKLYIGAGYSMREYKEGKFIGCATLKATKYFQVKGETNLSDRKLIDIQLRGKPVSIRKSLPFLPDFFEALKTCPKIVYVKQDDKRPYFQLKGTVTYSF